jgi:hypothetical protein
VFREFIRDAVTWHWITAWGLLFSQHTSIKARGFRLRNTITAVFTIIHLSVTRFGRTTIFRQEYTRILAGYVMTNCRYCRVLPVALKQTA